MPNVRLGEKEMINPQLEGKVAIVTGANHGIGAATAKALAAQGTKVFITLLPAGLPLLGTGVRRSAAGQSGRYVSVLRHAATTPRGCLE